MCKGRTFDSFHFIAKFPSLKDLLKRIERGVDTSFETNFSILLLMSSGPVALFGFKRFIKVSTSFAVQEMSVRLFKVLASKGGSWVLLLSMFVIEVKYLLRQSTFSSSVKQNVVWFPASGLASGGKVLEEFLFLMKCRTTCQNFFLSLFWKLDMDISKVL